MHCYVYKGEKKDDHFVYLNKELNIEQPEQCLPTAIIELLGSLSLVLDFELTAERKLPQAEATQVLNDIQSQGFYLQMPKKDMRAEEDRLFS